MYELELIKKIREKDLYYKIKAIVINATIKDGIIKQNDKFFDLKIDIFLEKPIPLDDLKNYLITFFIN
jgi:hypothetical protein